MKIFLLSTDQSSQIIGGVVGGGGGVLLIVIVAIIIIILCRRYKPVSFSYMSKKAEVYLCKIRSYRYMYMHSIAIS